MHIHTVCDFFSILQYTISGRGQLRCSRKYFRGKQDFLRLFNLHYSLNMSHSDTKNNTIVPLFTHLH